MPSRQLDVYVYKSTEKRVLTTGIESIAPTTADASQTATSAPPPNARSEYVSSESN